MTASLWEHFTNLILKAGFLLLKSDWAKRTQTRITARADGFEKICHKNPLQCVGIPTQLLTRLWHVLLYTNKEVFSGLFSTSKAGQKLPPEDVLTRHARPRHFYNEGYALRHCFLVAMLNGLFEKVVKRLSQEALH